MYLLILVFLAHNPSGLQEVRQEVPTKSLSECKKLQRQSGFITSQSFKGIYVGSFCEWRQQ